MVPINSWLRDIAEFLPIIIIVLSGVCSELIVEAQLKATRKYSWFKLTEQGIELHTPGANKNLLWAEVEQIVWDHDTGKNYTSYMVCELASARKKIRISQQFFRDDEVSLVFGIAMLQTNGRTLRT